VGVVGAVVVLGVVVVVVWVAVVAVSIFVSSRRGERSAGDGRERRRRAGPPE
jgi:hypothetical protein